MSQDPLSRIRNRTRPSGAERERSFFPQATYRSSFLQTDAERWGAETGQPLGTALRQVARAHLIQLAEQRILTTEHAAAGLQALSQPPNAPTWQHPVLDQLAASIAATEGGLLSGSSTEELSALASRMAVRDAVLGLHGDLLSVREGLATVATAHLTTLLLLTLDGQATQPSTLAHLLMAWIDALVRDSERVQQLWERVNVAPAGAVMGIATAMPIQRARLAALLGFAGVVPNTIDALAGNDWLLEVGTTSGIIAATLRRCITTLQHFARADVGLLVPEDAYLHADPALPQLREPRVLTALAQQVHAVSAAVADLLLQPASGDALDSRATREQQVTQVLDLVAALRASLRQLREVMETAVVNRAMFANRANRGFTTSAELLDLLVQDYAFTREKALELVNRIVVEATERGLESATLRTTLVDEIALKVTGVELGIEEETLAACLAPKRVIERRTMEGGPAAAQVRHALERHGFRLRRAREWETGLRTERERASQALDERVVVGIADPPTLQRPRRRTGDATPDAESGTAPSLTFPERRPTDVT